MARKKKVVAKKKPAAKKKVVKKASPKKATKKVSKKSKTRDMLLVGSKTKEALKAFDLNVSADALEGLNEMVYWYIEQAAKRTEANGRKTVRAHDFVAM